MTNKEALEAQKAEAIKQFDELFIFKAEYEARAKAEKVTLLEDNEK